VGIDYPLNELASGKRGRGADNQFPSVGQRTVGDEALWVGAQAAFEYGKERSIVGNPQQ
jgi:hypothetical protein